MAVSATVHLRISAKETYSADYGTPGMAHLFEQKDELTSGTGSNQADLVYSDSRSLAGTTENLDLAGGIASGVTLATQTMVKVVGMWFRNLSTTTGQVLTVGTTAAAAGFITWLAADGDKVKTGPSGWIGMFSPIDGFAVTATTADILTVGTSATFSYGVFLLGRSA